MSLCRDVHNNMMAVFSHIVIAGKNERQQIPAAISQTETSVEIACISEQPIRTPVRFNNR